MKPNKFQDSLEYSMDGHLKDHIENNSNNYENSDVLLQQWRLKKTNNTKQALAFWGQSISSLYVEQQSKNVHLQENKPQVKFQSQLSQLKQALKNVVEEQEKLLGKANQLFYRIEALEKQKEGAFIDRKETKQKPIIQQKVEHKLSEKSEKAEEELKIGKMQKSKQFYQFQKLEQMKNPQIDMNLLEFKLCLFQDQNLEKQAIQAKKTIKRSFKQPSHLPQPKQQKSNQPFNSSLDNKFKNIHLPELPKPYQLPINSFIKKDKSQLSLLNELKICVQDQNKMKNLEINWVGQSYVEGKIEQNGDFKNTYETILGVVILGGKQVIWTDIGLMKLKFASSQLHLKFFNRINKKISSKI